MKIQKKYQGAIPLNRVANEYNESEINTYSTQYLNGKLTQSVTVADGVEFETGRIVNGKKEYCIRLNLGPLPNATVIDYQTGLSNSYIVTNYHLYGLSSDTQCFSLPFFNLSDPSHYVLGYVKGGPSVVCTKSNYDVSAYDLVVEIAYIK